MSHDQKLYFFFFQQSNYLMHIKNCKLIAKQVSNAFAIY